MAGLYDWVQRRKSDVQEFDERMGALPKVSPIITNVLEGAEWGRNYLNNLTATTNPTEKKLGEFVKAVIAPQELDALGMATFTKGPRFGKMGEVTPSKGAVESTGKTSKPEGGQPQIGQKITFIRYGKPTEKSTNWQTNQLHEGMSVYSLNKDGSAQQIVRGEFADRKDVYTGTGEVVGFGADGEPLVSNYKVRKATKLEDEKAYYGGISRAQWLQEHGYDEKGNKVTPVKPEGGNPLYDWRVRK